MRPVDHQPGALELAAEVVDVPRDQLRRMHADLEREVLGVDAERVEAERLEDVVPLQPLESSIDVVAREREEVADVQPLGRRVREHHQRVVRARGVRDVGHVGTALCPASAPFCLNLPRIVRRDDF